MCMGKTHAASTTAMALIGVIPLSAAAGHTMSPGPAIAAAVVAGGYGLLPDLDHPQATLARILGPVTKAIATLTSELAGGHRRGTHTIWFAAIATVAAWLATTRFGVWGEAPLLFAGLFLAFMLMRLAPRHDSGVGEIGYALEAAAATVLIVSCIPDRWWLPWAVGAGVIGHIVGDCLTTGVVPVLYPLAPTWRLRVPILGDTGSTREAIFGWLCGAAALWLAFAALTGHDWRTAAWLSEPSTWRLTW